MLKKLAQAGACFLMLSAGMTGAAEASGFVGGSIGAAVFDYPDVSNGNYTKLYGGFELPNVPVFFELQTMSSGDADIEGLQDTTLNVSGFQVGAGYHLILNRRTGLGFLFKGGIYNTETELSDPNGFTIYGPGTATEKGSGVYLGAGFDCMFVPNFGLRFDLEALVGVKDFVDDKTVTVFSVGPVFRFGNRE